MSLTLTETRLVPILEEPPRDLLGWFLAAYRADVPMRISTGGDYPELSEGFIAYVERPWAEDRDETYRSPMRAAMARLRGSGRMGPYPFMHDVLYRTAAMEGDWDRACMSMGIVAEARWPYVQAALVRLYALYRMHPGASMARNQRTGRARSREATR